MSKLLGLKEWVTIKEAAKHLTVALNEEVTESDVLRFSLDGHLKISVNFINGAVARGWVIKPMSEARTAPSLDGSSNVILGIPLLPDEVLEPLNGVINIRGVWELPMIWGERLCVENLYLELNDLPENTMINLDGVFVGDRSTHLLSIQSDWAESDEYSKLAEGKSLYDSDRYYPASKFSDDSIFVITTDALNDLIKKLNGNENSKNPTDTNRKQRIKDYVNKEYANGKSKKSAFEYLATEEGCDVENIKRIYYDKDKYK